MTKSDFSSALAPAMAAETATTLDLTDRLDVVAVNNSIEHGAN